MHALEWIQQHGHHLRSINAAKLRRALDRPRRTCTWCGEPVGRGRSTWCSDQCVEAFQLRCSPQAISRYLERTRPLVCAICGLDIAWIQRCERRSKDACGDLQRHRYGYGHETRWVVARGQRRNRRGRRNLRRLERWASLWSYTSGTWQRWLARRGLAGIWEADHVVPVVEGGGLCGPEGYRCLCIPCHRGVTAQLAARRAAARRPKRTHHQKTLEIHG